MASDFVTKFDGAIDHELRRNLVLHAGLSKILEDYHGIDRNDDVFAFNFSANYMLNRNFYFSFIYEYESRKSEPELGGIYDYRINKYTLNIRAQI